MTNTQTFINHYRFCLGVELIQLKGVSREFGRNKVLQDVTITIEEEDVLGIIGESGSGKTTLLNLITGFIEPTAGEALYYTKATHEPRNLNKNLGKIKKYIGFTPQHNSFYHKLTLEENLLHFGLLYGLPKATLLANMKSILETMSLYDHRQKLAEHLSGGMQRRLDIACSLIHKPKLLVLDEPTADLDPVLQKEILWLLTEMNKQGITIVIASHSLDNMEHICNKVAIIHKGKVYSHGRIDEVKKPFFKEYFTIHLRPGDSKDKIVAVLKTLPVRKIVDEGAKLVVYPLDIQKTVSGLLNLIHQENLYLHDLDMRKPSLVEIFEQITAEN